MCCSGKLTEMSPFIQVFFLQIFRPIVMNVLLKA